MRNWESDALLGPNTVPKTLYLPDGRAIPTCVVEAEPDEKLPPPAAGPGHSSSLLGGGYACLRDHQGDQSTGTFACLVRKGGSYYALTNRHVAGGDGEEVRAYVRGEFVPVGKTSSVAVDRLLLSAVFPNWPGDRTYLTLDAGLVRVDDIRDWTSQAFGIGEIGNVFDATAQSVTLDLIGCPVRAFGGVSGVTEGEVRALFFRYQSLGGFDYATDVLIGPRTSERDRKKRPAPPAPITRPGDSGTLWFYDPPTTLLKGDLNDQDFEYRDDTPPERGRLARRLEPIAMQWGGQRFVEPDRTVSAYALASFLSSICRALDVEVIRDWSTGHEEYWGKIGHFSIGWKACDRVTGALGTLMKANQANIGFSDETLSDGANFRVGREGFVPLADVPDYVWIMGKGRGSEPIQHFADIDIVDINGGPTMLDACMSNPKKVSASVWKGYFDGFANAGVGPNEGALPFRVWQIWEDMAGFVSAKDVKRFVAAAGVLAHYVGDASQPLHCSYLHHGVQPTKTVHGRKYPVRKGTPEEIAYKKTRPAKIHAIYEEGMLEVDPATALADVDDALDGKAKAVSIKSGHDAAVATVKLMFESQQRLAPMKIIQLDDPNLTERGRAESLWKHKVVREATAQSLAASVRLLAALWTSAWNVGQGSKIPSSKLVTQKESALMAVYRNPNFLPSLSLAELVTSKKGNKKRFEP